MVTIRDVAQRAGVGTTTVTKVLADRPKVASRTRQRVLQAIEELDYQPNAAGRALRSSTVRTIGVITPTPRATSFSRGYGGFVPAVFGGVGDWACQHGYDVLWITAASTSGLRPSYADLYKSARVAGLIDAVIDLKDPRVAALKDSQCPFVLIGNPDDDTLLSVDAANLDAGETVAQAFVKRNYSPVAYIGMLNSPASRDRLAGLRSGMAAAGHALQPDLVALGEGPKEPDQTGGPDDPYDEPADGIAWLPWIENFGYSAARKWLSRRTRPRAIFAFADGFAVGAMRACQDANLDVPEHVAIVGFGDEAACRWLQPSLASVRQPAHALGYRGAALLEEAISEKPAERRVVLTTRLIERASLGSTTML